MSLPTGASLRATVAATKDVVAARIGREAFTTIVATHPDALEKVTCVVAARRARNEAFLEEVRRDAPPARRAALDPVAGAGQWILARVRHLLR